MTTCRNVVLCICGSWHRVPLRATEEHRFKFDCGLSGHITIEEPGDFVQFYWGGGVVQIVDMAAGQENLYLFLEKAP